MRNHRLFGGGTARVALAALPVISLLSVGCVPQDKYDHLLTANRSLQEQLASAEQDRDSARGQLSTLRSQLDDSRSQYGALESRYGDLSNSVDGLDAANREYMRRITQLEVGPLPEEIETAIHDLAARYPRMLTFDAENGLLRFSSDFTFDLGSTDLKPDAQETIQALASILNEQAGTSLEVRVVGHTDNVPIGKPETKRKHPTNTHLSVHRAIAVSDSMIDAGVAPTRIQVAGYGEFRPIVPNGTRGAAANRRVEIFLAAMTDMSDRTATGSNNPTPEKGRSAASAEGGMDAPMK